MVSTKDVDDAKVGKIVEKVGDDVGGLWINDWHRAMVGIHSGDDTTGKDGDNTGQDRRVVGGAPARCSIAVCPGGGLVGVGENPRCDGLLLFWRVFSVESMGVRMFVVANRASTWFFLFDEVEAWDGSDKRWQG